jgi:hypothetical protein
MPRVRRLGLRNTVVHDIGELPERAKALRDPARWIDGRRDAVVGGSDDPSRIFGCAHTNDFQVLFVRGAGAEIAVVGKVHENLRAAAGELAHQVREGRFVTDEDADTIGEHHHAIAGREIARLFRHPVHPGENLRHKFAEGNELDFVVFVQDLPGGVDHDRGVERRALFRVADRAEQKVSLRGFRNLAGIAQERGIVQVQRHGHLRPDNEVDIVRA